MAQWSNPESGILRKNKRKDNFEDLLVFGYACKIFRDDEKALHIDQGKHLIPWMGDEKLKIDRYDCRGHLSDISRYEANREGFDAMRWLGLDDNERKLEQLCDEERYYSLHINEEEEEMYKEEEQKRNQTNEFHYSYDVPMNPEAKEEIPTVPENEEEEIYVPPPNLDVPVDIAIPKTVKENARIEKTALFVSTQGPQMEILIKAKQSDNPQFSFLNQGDALYKFYRHVLNAIKTGRYQIRRASNNDQNSADTSGGESGDHYLHPSLVSSESTTDSLPLPPATTIPSVPYRPSVNCAYSQLVNRIQGVAVSATATPTAVPLQAQQQLESTTTVGEVESSTTNALAIAARIGQNVLAQMTLEQQQQYYQYYLQQQYYDYYKQMAQNAGVAGEEIPPRPEMSIDPNVQAYFQQTMYAQYFQQAQNQPQTTNPYAQIVSNVNKDVTNPYTQPENPDISKKPVIYGSTRVATPTPNATPTTHTTPAPDAPKTTNASPKKASLLTLMQNYGSDTEDEEEEEETGVSCEESEKNKDYKLPEGETKVVIDKMASYVVKNGEDFERIVRSRADPRFVFLNEDHEYYRYYRHRVDEETRGKNKDGGEEEEKVETETREVVKVNNVNNGKSKEKKVKAPVSFSIKKPKEETPKEIKSALPVDEETEDEEEEEDKGKEQSQQENLTPPHPLSSLFSSNHTEASSISIMSAKMNDKVLGGEEQKKIEKVEEKIKESAKEKETTEEKEITTTKIDEKEDKEETDSKKEELHLIKAAQRFKKNGAVLDVEDDPILEMIDLTDDAQEDKNIFISVKDEDIFDLGDEKNVNKKKETSESRALQLERRKKAMEFLKLKQGASAANSAESTTDLSNEAPPTEGGAGTTIVTIDLSNVKSPKSKRRSSDEDEEERRSKRLRSKDRLRDERKSSKRTRESEKTPNKKDREKSRKSRSPRRERKSETEDGEMSETDDNNGVGEDDHKSRKRCTHKKKKSHKRKHSKSKHSSKSKKKSKKKEVRTSSSDSDS